MQRWRLRASGGARFSQDPWEGRPGADSYGDQILAALGPEGIDCRAGVRVPGASTALSAILLDSRGERTIVTHRDPALDMALPAQPEESCATPMQCSSIIISRILCCPSAKRHGRAAFPWCSMPIEPRT
jgi:sugar/nucleoside kinase (ribokinase family)